MIDTSIAIPFGIEPAIPAPPIITSLNPASGPTQTSGAAPTIALVGENLFNQWRVDLVGKTSHSSTHSSNFEADNYFDATSHRGEIIFRLPTTSTSNAGAQPVTITTPFGQSDPIDFTYIAEYTSTVNITADNTSPLVGDTVTYTWHVDDPAGDAISCVLTTNDQVKYQFDDCRAVTSQTHTFTQYVGSSGFTRLRVTDENGLKNSASVRINLTRAAPQPVIEALSPDRGLRGGGNSVVITGQHFTGATSVTFDHQEVSFTVDSDTQITAIAPAGINSDWVRVNVPAGGVSNSLGYRYLNAPVVETITPTQGYAGDTITMRGSVFRNFNDVDTIFVGGQSADFVVNGAREITFTVPADVQGTVDVVASTLGQASTPISFTILANAAPVIEDLTVDQTRLDIGRTLTLSWQVRDVDSAELTCEIDWGNGLSTQSIRDCNAVTETTYMYGRAGNYTIELAVSDGESTTHQTVTIEALDAGFSTDASNPQIQAAVARVLAAPEVVALDKSFNTDNAQGFVLHDFVYVMILSQEDTSYMLALVKGNEVVGVEYYLISLEHDLLFAKNLNTEMVATITNLSSYKPTNQLHVQSLGDELLPIYRDPLIELFPVEGTIETAQVSCTAATPRDCSQPVDDYYFTWRRMAALHASTPAALAINMGACIGLGGTLGVCAATAGTGTLLSSASIQIVHFFALNSSRDEFRNCSELGIGGTPQTGLVTIAFIDYEPVLNMVFVRSPFVPEAGRLAVGFGNPNNLSLVRRLMHEANPLAIDLTLLNTPYFPPPLPNNHSILDLEEKKIKMVLCQN